MSLFNIANGMGIFESALDDLLKGKGCMGIASAVGSSESSVQDFLEGNASFNLAHAVGASESSLLELRNRLGPHGAIGFIIGFALATRRAEKHRP
jgi:hypothetical protein